MTCEGVLRVAVMLGFVLVAVARARTVESKEAALASHLATLRQSIAQYSRQHGGQLPGQDGWEELVRQLTTSTDAHGEPGSDYGPYVRVAWPDNPVTRDASGVVEDTMRAEPTREAPPSPFASPCARGEFLRHVLGGDSQEPSWVYCRMTGEFRANVTGAGPSGVPYFSL